MVGGELRERPRREQAQVGATGVAMTPAVLGVQRVSDDDLVAHVQGHRLHSEPERDHVVPAGEVVGRDACEAVRAQHAPDLAHEQVRAAHVLENLVGVHDVEALRLEGQPVVEVGDRHLDAARASGGGVTLDQLHARHSPAPQGGRATRAVKSPRWVPRSSSAPPWPAGSASRIARRFASSEAWKTLAQVAHLADILPPLANAGGRRRAGRQRRPAWGTRRCREARCGDPRGSRSGAGRATGRATRSTRRRAGEVAAAAS